MKSMLIADDEVFTQKYDELFQNNFPKSRFNLFFIDNPNNIKDQIENNKIDILILDHKWKNKTSITGKDVLKKLRDAGITIPVLYFTQYGKEVSIHDMHVLDIWDFLLKPIDIDELKYKVNEIVKRIESEHTIEILTEDNIKLMIEKCSDVDTNLSEYEYEKNERGDKIYTASPVLKDILEDIEKYAAKYDDDHVLLLGETGVGKTYIAEYIHFKSSRFYNGQEFLIYTWSSKVDWVVTHDLFGCQTAHDGSDEHERNPYIGFLERNSDATIFMDEIGDLSEKMQARIMELIENKRFCRYGVDDVFHNTNSRFIFATNRKLKEEVEKSTFRRDLFRRLKRDFVYSIPSLKDRKTDIILLTNVFVKKYNKMYEKSIKSISPDFFRHLLAQPFPENVGELDTLIKNMVMRCNKEILQK